MWDSPNEELGLNKLIIASRQPLDNITMAIHFIHVGLSRHPRTLFKSNKQYRTYNKTKGDCVIVMIKKKKKKKTTARHSHLSGVV